MNIISLAYLTQEVGMVVAARQRSSIAKRFLKSALVLDSFKIANNDRNEIFGQGNTSLSLFCIEKFVMRQ